MDGPDLTRAREVFQSRVGDPGEVAEAQRLYGALSDRGHYCFGGSGNNMPLSQSIAYMKEQLAELH